MWNLAAIREIISLPKGQYSVDNVAFSVDGKYLASTSSENYITVYDLSTMKQLHRLPKLSITDIF
jgi:WD40 repeat protein